MRFPETPTRTLITTISRICVVISIVYLAGCMSAQIAPTDALSQVRRIAIVPIQMPIAVTPALIQTFEAKTGSVGLPASPGIGGLASIVLLYTLSVEWPKQEARRNRAIELLAEWAETHDPWSPELVLAENAAALLRQSSTYRNIDIRVNRALALPGVETSEPTWHMENWMKTRRAWYWRADSLVNFTEAKAFGEDAVLEIAAGPVEVGRDHFFLHVAVKLIDMSTNKVLARSNCVNYADAAPLENIFQNEGKLFKSIFSELSNRILDQCLRETGLLP